MAVKLPRFAQSRLEPSRPVRCPRGRRLRAPQATGLPEAPPAKKPCFGTEAALAATEALSEDHFLAQEKPEEEKSEEDKREAENMGQGLLKLPPELRHMIYTYVFDDQILKVTKADRQIRVVGATNAHPFGLPSTCRQLYQETKNLPRVKTAYRIVTYRFVSLWDTWAFSIFTNINRFYALLNSIPAPYNNRFEVVGVTRGHDGVEYMAPHKIVGYTDDVESSIAQLKVAIHKIYPMLRSTSEAACNPNVL